MDTTIPAADQLKVAGILDAHVANGLQYHDLRTRQSAAQQFISVHVLVPGKWSVQRGHDLLEKIESEIHEALPRALITTHLEPVEDPAAWESTILENQEQAGRVTQLRKQETEAVSLGLFLLWARVQSAKDASAPGKSG